MIDHGRFDTSLGRLQEQHDDFRMTNTGLLKILQETFVESIIHRFRGCSSIFVKTAFVPGIRISSVRPRSRSAPGFVRTVRSRRHTASKRSDLAPRAVRFSLRSSAPLHASIDQHLVGGLDDARPIAIGLEVRAAHAAPVLAGNLALENLDRRFHRRLVAGDGGDDLVDAHLVVPQVGAALFVPTACDRTVGHFAEKLASTKEVDRSFVKPKLSRSVKLSGTATATSFRSDRTFAGEPRLHRFLAGARKSTRRLPSAPWAWPSRKTPRAWSILFRLPAPDQNPSPERRFVAKSPISTLKRHGADLNNF